MHRIVLAVGGASGAIYAKRLFDHLVLLEAQWASVGVVMSTNAKVNWELEIGTWSDDLYPFEFYGNQDYNAPFASGSAKYGAMVICPCSMGLVGRIAAGVSNDLISRSADVILKERRRLVLVARETPLSLIHLRNMTTITEAGGIICPAIPSFYSEPESIDQIVDTVIHRVLDLIGLDPPTKRWGE